MSKELRFPRVNTVVLSGRLTRDVDLRYIPSGTPIAKLSVAFDRAYQKNGEWHKDVSYIDVLVWSKRGEQCVESLHKGDPVLVEGRLNVRIYTDKDNVNHKIPEIVSTKISFLEKGADWQPSQEPVADNSNGSTDDDVPF